MTQPHDAPADYFDGVTAGKRQVLVSLDPETRALILKSENAITLDQWPLDTLRQIKGPSPQKLVLRQAGAADQARLTFQRAQDIHAIKAAAPALGQKDVTRIMMRKTALWSVAAFGALATILFLIIPALAGGLARLLPVDTETNIGKATLRQIEWFFNETEGEDWFCSTPAGDAAVAKMTSALLMDVSLPYDLSVRVVNHDMINAFALPGGQIILMNGFIQAANTPEQVAGVLAHELGHVANRDPVEQALRSAGTAGLLSLMFGDATGGTVIALMGESLINASYSRQAEARADDYALDRMNAANLNPDDFAQFFDLLLEEMGQDGDMAEHLAWASTHPASQGRADKARAAVQDGRDYASVLTDAEWATLRDICG